MQHLVLAGRLRLDLLGVLAAEIFSEEMRDDETTDLSDFMN